MASEACGAVIVPPSPSGKVERDSAPGKPAKRLSKVWFSRTMTTRCSIRPTVAPLDPPELDPPELDPPELVPPELELDALDVELLVLPEDEDEDEDEDDELPGRVVAPEALDAVLVLAVEAVP